jgi:hypothetical protein
MISDTVNLALICAAMYDFVITNFANPLYLLKPNKCVLHFFVHLAYLDKHGQIISGLLSYKWCLMYV